MPSRREFLARAGQAGLAAAAASGLGGLPALVGAAQRREEIIYPKGRAEHCIFVWLGGGAAHIDTWDPKRVGDGKKIAGSAYPAIDTAIPGVQVCEHLSHCALGINPGKHLRDDNDRPVPITDRGEPVRKVFG